MNLKQMHCRLCDCVTFKSYYCITDVSAFATGRQFIMTSEAGKQTVDVLFMFLSDMPPQKVTKLKKYVGE